MQMWVADLRDPAVRARLAADAAIVREHGSTAEGHAFRRDELDALLALAGKGTNELFAAQQAALDG